MTVVVNPAVPLACERVGGGDADGAAPDALAQEAALCADAACGLWHLSVAPLPSSTARWASAAVASAAALAASGFRAPDAAGATVASSANVGALLLGLPCAPRPPSDVAAAAAAAMARDAALQTAADALALSSHAADAWNLRALRCATSLEEALGFYEEAMRCAERALAPATRAAWDAWTPADAALGVWGAWPEMQPWVRAAHGVANTLRKLGRWEASRAAYEALQARDTPTHHTDACWP